MGKNVNKRYLSDLVVCTYPFIVFDERSYKEMRSTNRVEIINYVITLLHKPYVIRERPLQVNLFQKYILILLSTNPKYDKRLFIELRVQYMKIPIGTIHKGRLLKGVDMWVLQKEIY